MDIHDVMRIVGQERHKKFEKSTQLSLGEFISQLEKVEDKPGKEVYFDFGYFYPTKGDSWRGSYSEFAIGFSEETKTHKDFLEHLKNNCLNQYFEGYKGGDFKMVSSTPVWVANYSESGWTAVVGVKDAGWATIILTQYNEY